MREAVLIIGMMVTMGMTYSQEGPVARVNSRLSGSHRDCSEGREGRGGGGWWGGCLENGREVIPSLLGFALNFGLTA